MSPRTRSRSARATSATTACCSRPGASPRGSAVRAPTSPACTSFARWTTRSRSASCLSPGGRRIALIGAGWIGLEVAAAARGYGNDVTVVGPSGAAERGDRTTRGRGVRRPAPRARGRPPHVDEGPRDRRRRDGRVTGVEIEGGEVVPADSSWSASARPRDRARRSGGPRGRQRRHDRCRLPYERRRRLRRRRRRQRVPSRARPAPPRGALGQRRRRGQAAGRAMAGQAVEFDEMPYFYTDQYDLGMEFSGYGTLAEGIEPVFRGDRDAARVHRVLAGRRPGRRRHERQRVGRERDGPAAHPRRARVDPAAARRPVRCPLEALDRGPSECSTALHARLGRPGHHAIRCVASPVAEVDFRRSIAVMAVVNRTPDSFYDRGATFGPRRGHRRCAPRGRRRAPRGSTSAARGSGRVPPSRWPRRSIAWRRWSRRCTASTPRSRSTPSTPRSRAAAIAAGADVINDTTGSARPGDRRGRRLVRGDPRRSRTARPQPRQWFPRPSTTTSSARSPRSSRAGRRSPSRHGVPEDRIVLDPGHDLNKNTRHSLELTRRFGELDSRSGSRCSPPSRTRTSSARRSTAPATRASPAPSRPRCSASPQGARILRMHNVAESVDAAPHDRGRPRLARADPPEAQHGRRPERGAMTAGRRSQP